MACSFPMYRIDWKALTNNGWCWHQLAYVYEKRVRNGGVIIQRPEFEMIQKEYPYLAGQIQEIPCGKCIQCRLSYSRDWANRCMLELKTCANAYFLTLTYDNEHLNFAPFVDVATGEVGSRPVLVGKDLTNFMKRLRARCADLGQPGQRFFACGEYGEESLRPHYHMILYNVPPDLLRDSQTWPDSQPGAPLWTAPELSKLWPFGVVVFGNVNWETCAYVARYVVKKAKGQAKKAQLKAHEIVGLPPWVDEFVRMSRRPGIGREYYERNKSTIYKTDEVFLPVKGQIQAVQPSKYYDRLYDVEYPEDMRAIKWQRQRNNKYAMEARLTLTDLNEEEYLLLKNDSKEEQAKKLVRPSI